MNNDTPKFRIHYFKNKNINLNNLVKQYNVSKYDNQLYNPFIVSQIQNYNPIYNELFLLDDNNFNKIGLNQKYKIVDLNTIQNQETNEMLDKSVFVKFAPLLDPSRYMAGKYESEITDLSILPTINNINTIYPKLSCYHNVSYIDNFFNYLSSQLLNTHGFVNGIDYYGSHLMIQNLFKVDITDDLEYLQSSKFFYKNMNKLFHITAYNQKICMNETLSKKPKISINDDAFIEFDEITNNIEQDNSIEQNIINGDLEVVYTKNTDDVSKEESDDNDSKVESDDNDSKVESDDDDSKLESDDDDSKEENDDNRSNTESSCWETESDSISDTSDMQTYAYINNFPVQSIYLEKCDGTIDTLLNNQLLNEEQYVSAMMQIIMSLLYYQKSFYFTHNDLHTNNIMYNNTDIEFLYYKYKNIVYKVPTFGKIYKIIDFGRSIYCFNGKIFCSDSFDKNGDAATQYNCEPFINKNKPRIEPNYSFDLCRLGCSMFDFCIDMDNDREDNFNIIQKITHRWCMDDQNRNVLYKKNGNERYPNFKLYKMIARTVHHHTPELQLEFPEFKQYQTKENIPNEQHIINLDLLVCYA